MNVFFFGLYGDRSRVYPVFHTKSAGIGPSSPEILMRIKPIENSSHGMLTERGIEKC